MKAVILSLVLTAMTVSLSTAQVLCAQTIDNRTFAQNLQNIRIVGSEQMRLNRALNMARTFCLHSGQVFDLAALFIDDNARFDVVVTAYPGMIDPDNSFTLLDVFSHFSTAFRAYDYMRFIDNGRNRPFVWTQQVQVPIQQVPVTVQPVPVPVQPVPQPVCMVTEPEMQEMRASIRAVGFDASMRDQAFMLLRSKQCFTAQQIASIVSLFSFASTQVEVAKFAYDFCIDPDNYFRVINVLGFDSSKRQVRDYISTR